MNVAQITFGLLVAVFAACQPVIVDTSEERVAEQFVLANPTYAFDGSHLELQESFVRESYPEQYVFVYSFTSSSAGFGDRSDQVVAQVITEHEIEVVVVRGEVVSAVIDGVWDEKRQELITTQDVELSFTPMQCVEYAWDVWYAQQDEFVPPPATSQLIREYYASQGVRIGDVAVVEMDGAVCMACEICPVGVVYYVTVDRETASVLEDDGWLANHDMDVAAE